MSRMALRQPARWLLVLLLAASAAAQVPQFQEPGGPRLPQDEGAPGLGQMLRRLQHTGRLLHIVAHPDDEDGAMLTLMSRGRGAQVMLLTLTRGEGGQNRTGSGLSDELGVLRTLELLASDRYYGVEQRFTRAADFGYSKSAEETLRKWPREVVLADVVRVIREFRPDVIVTRFTGTPRDGHGHHQTSTILAREAFRAAADPTQFPEQLKEGLQPGQAKKFYTGRFRGMEGWTIRLETSVSDPLLGATYAEFAMQGLKHQLSQGAFDWRLSPPPNYTHYALEESVLPGRPPGTKEQDFFEGIDTSLGAGSDDPDVKAAVAAARRATAPGAAQVTVAEALLDGLAATEHALQRGPSGSTSSPDPLDLLKDLESTRDQFREAARLATGVSLSFRIGNAGSSPILLPGYKVTADETVSLPAGVTVSRTSVQVPKDWNAEMPQNPSPATGKVQRAHFSGKLTPPPDAAPNRPYWHRTAVSREFVHAVDDASCLTLPFCPPSLRASAVYTVGNNSGVLTAAAEAHADPPARWTMVAPPVEIAFVPPGRVFPASSNGPMTVSVRVTTLKPADYLPGERKLQERAIVVRLAVPDGWRSQPRQHRLVLRPEGDAKIVTFNVFVPKSDSSYQQLRALAEYDGRTYSDSFTIVQRDDLGAYPYVHPATQRVSVVDVKTPPGLKVGYVMGAGDDIPDVLRQASLDVALIPPADLATADLARFGTIVLGIRAHETVAQVRDHNQRLLDYVANGGTLVVQYHPDRGPFPYAPAPLEIGRERVSVEEAPVEILAPDDPLFSFPNRITARDFDGWVQERGLYFASSWDPRFQPLLASSDPGEAPLKGGLLRMRHGKGTYIFTGYSFFRQLPAGVPGAIRLFVNLVSAGHERP